MEKYKILINRPELSKEQIHQGMDFEKLKSELPKNPGSLLKYLLLGIVGIIAIALSFIYFQNRGGINQGDNALIVLNNNENPIKMYKLNTEKDTMLIFDSGSIIKIEKGTFVDENGNKIEGKVDFLYREFHSVPDILLSGIPMKYDSAGTTFHFESAGMFEILATKDGKPVYINKNKNIEVQLVSLDSNSTKYNQYYLSNRNSNWNYVNKDTLNKIIVMIPKTKADTSAGFTKYITQKLLKPEKANPNKQQFKIEVPRGLFPELEVFQNVIFEVSLKNKSFDLEKANKNWYGVNIERIGKTKEYLITFTDPHENYEVIAYPVFDTTNYTTAVNKYNLLNESFAKKLNEKAVITKSQEDKLNSQLSNYVEAMNKYRELLKKNQKIYSDSMAIVIQNRRFTQSTQEIVYRTFQVKEFGIWNSDCPQNFPKGIILAANYKNENGELIKPVAIYLVEKGKNALYTFSLNQNISFNPESENVLIIITTDNTISWVPTEAFNAVDKSIKNYTFKVKSLKKTTYSLSDINDII